MTLDDLFSISKGKKPPVLFDESPDGVIPFIKIDGIRNAGQHQYCEASPNLVTCDRNDVLVVWDGAYCGLAGFGLEGAIGSTIARLRPKSGNVFGPYAGYFLQSKFEEIQKNATGAAIPHVNGGHLRRLEIPLPPLDEQKRIAAVLDKADALRRQRQESLQLTEKLLQSVFIDMFGDPATNAKAWPQASLTEVCKLSSGGTPSKSNTVFWQGTLPWFTPKDLKKNELADSTDHVSEIVLEKSNLKLYPAETVLIVVRGMILAHTFPVSIIKRAGLVNQDIKALAPVADLHPQFLAACLRAQSSLILTKVTTAGHGTKRLDMESLSEVQILLPPRDLQMKFVEVVSCHRELIEDGASSSTHAERLFSSIQQRAFRGELDLSRLKLEVEAESPEVTPALEDKLDTGSGDSIAWSEDFFKYRTLSQVLQPPFSFADIWEAVEYDMEEASYETVKDKVFAYVEEGTLEQQFDEERKEIVFRPRP